MPDATHGLEDPIPQRIRSEHRRLYGWLLQVRQAFHRGDAAAGVMEAFVGLRREFERHFDQEDNTYYGPIAARHPELKPNLDAFSVEHEGFRRGLAAIAEQLERGDLEGASPAVLQLALAFERHESAEEDLLRSLDDFDADEG